MVTNQLSKCREKKTERKVRQSATLLRSYLCNEKKSRMDVAKITLRMGLYSEGPADLL